jgi:hypothetical protein
MKAMIAILIVLAIGFVGWRLYEYYGRVNTGQASEQTAPIEEIRPERLAGLPYQLEPKLREAQAAGPVVFKAFIDNLRNYPDVKDPRLAWIELDYVVMLSVSDPIEAKRLFAKIKKRTPPDSPILPRLRALAKTYE